MKIKINKWNIILSEKLGKNSEIGKEKNICCEFEETAFYKREGEREDNILFHRRVTAIWRKIRFKPT